MINVMLCWKYSLAFKYAKLNIQNLSLKDLKTLVKNQNSFLTNNLFSVSRKEKLKTDK